MSILSVGLTAAWLFLSATVTSGASDLRASPKIVIAHRGASGYLPEHTLAAYAVAHAMGADYVEPDLAMTRDGILICLHDMTLEATTDVADVFPERARSDGKWYAVDFMLAEIKRLRVRERHPGRFPKEALLFDVPTLEECIRLVNGLNTSTGRIVGIYPELKDPAFYEREGLPFARTLIETLERHGYSGAEARVYIQCFCGETLRRLRFELGTSLPLVQLIADDAQHDPLVADAGLREIARYAQGIGPAKKRIEADPTLVSRAHQAGLLVHPYTFRADLTPSKYGSLESELSTFLFTYGVDGAFVDHPDRMRRLLEPPR